jgi:SAM-dependent methyltransferase
MLSGMSVARLIPACAFLLLASSCSQPPRDGEEERPAPTTGAAPVRDGVLARATARDGSPIRVEQKDGRRLLYIGDTVHAAVPWTESGPDLAAVDPVVDLVRAMRPQARTALVIGLGSGKTAGDLTRAGLEVTAIEIEPAVIELARKHFGYRGKAIAADGLAWMKGSSASFDVLLMDAFVGTDAPPALVAPDALRLMRKRTASGGVTALRLVGSPADPAVVRILTDLRRTRDGVFFDQVFGSGVAAEVQNLYLLASSEPLSCATAGLPLWPVVVDADALGSIAGDPATRTITIAGYVHRMPDGALALDLTHQEMGAVRYLLTGRAAQPLAAALPAGARFPTEGDIGSDGDTSATLKPLFGGGGVKRSDMRFSPLVAAVTGTAHLVAVVHPDAASGVPDELRRGAVTDERLPWGGALYQLDVSELHWTLDRAGWRALSPRLAGEIASAAAAVKRGALEEAAAAVSRYAAELEKGLGPHAELVPACRAARSWRDDFAAEAKRAKARGHAFALAAACDLLEFRMAPAAALADAAPLERALYQCAVDRYEAIARTDSSAYGYDAAARLLTLLDRPDASAAQRQRAARTLRAIQKKHHALPMEFPPDAVGQ